MTLLILLLISSITLQATQAKVANQANILGLEDNLLWEKFKLQVMSKRNINFYWDGMIASCPWEIDLFEYYNGMFWLLQHVKAYPHREEEEVRKSVFR